MAKHTLEETYFPTYSAAQAAAQELPEKWQQHYRIRSYTLGWAVQLHCSGPYLGSLNPETHLCRWCPPEIS